MVSGHFIAALTVPVPHFCAQLFETEALLDMGEIVCCSEGSRKVVSQLERRLDVLEWFIRRLCPEVANCVRAGHSRTYVITAE